MLPSVLGVHSMSTLLPGVLMSSEWSVSGGRSCNDGAIPGVFSSILMVSTAMISRRMYCHHHGVQNEMGYAADGLTGVHSCRGSR